MHNSFQITEPWLGTTQIGSNLVRNSNASTTLDLNGSKMIISQIDLECLILSLSKYLGNWQFIGKLRDAIEKSIKDKTLQNIILKQLAFEKMLMRNVDPCLDQFEKQVL